MYRVLVTGSRTWEDYELVSRVLAGIARTELTHRPREQFTLVSGACPKGADAMAEDLAEKLGEPNVTITRFKRMNCNSNCNDALYSLADKFTWRVNIPRPALNVRRANCNSNCNSALQEYTPSVIECAISERKPAESDVIFAYQA